MSHNNRIVYQNKFNKTLMSKNIKNNNNSFLNKNVLNTSIMPIVLFKKLTIEFYYFLVEKNIEYHLNKDNKLFIKINSNYYFITNINSQYKQYLPSFVFKNIIPNDIDIIDWNKTPHYISSLLDIVMIQSYYYNDDNHDLTKLKDFEYNSNELNTSSTINHFPLNYIHYQNTLYFIPYINNKEYLSLTTNELTKIYYPLNDIIKNYPNRFLINNINDFMNLYYTFDDFKSLMYLDKQTLYKLYLQKSLDNLFITENKVNNFQENLLIKNKIDDIQDLKNDKKIIIKKEINKNVNNKLLIDNRLEKIDDNKLLIEKDNNLTILCLCEYDKDISNNLYINHFIKYYQLFCKDIIFDNKFKFVNNILLADNDYEFIEIGNDKQKIFDIYKDKYDWIFFVKINEFLFFKKDITIENKENKLENKIKSFYLYKSFLKKCKKFSFVKIHHHSITINDFDNKSNLIEIIIDKILNNSSNIINLENKSYIYNSHIVNDITKYTNTLNKINTNIYQIVLPINENQSKIKVVTNNIKKTSKYRIVSQINDIELIK